MKKKTCPYCNKEIRKRIHLKECRPNVDINESYILMIENQYECKKNDVVNDYKSGLSLPDIKLKYGLPYKITTEFLKLAGEKTRSISESSNNNRLDKYKKTCKKKYGVDNVSKSNIIKEKKIKTFTKNYGVNNIFKTDGFSNHVSNILLEKYGKQRITNPEKISKSRLKFSDEKWNRIHSKTRKTIQSRYESDNSEKTWDKYSSKLEKMVENVLCDNNIEFKSQKFVDGRSYDFHIVNTNILIEVNGDYWHANPNIYNIDEKINYAGKGLINVVEIWNRDKNKLNAANKYGFNVIVLWETDIICHNKNNTLHEYVLNKLIK